MMLSDIGEKGWIFSASSGVPVHCTYDIGNRAWSFSKALTWSFLDKVEFPKHYRYFLREPFQ